MVPPKRGPAEEAPTVTPDFVNADWYTAAHAAQLVERNGAALVSFIHKNRRTEMRVGRYVRRFSRLPDEEVERIAAAADVALRGNRLRFAQDAGEIETLYRNGPRSCMSPDACEYPTGGLQSVRVYAGPDLAVTYLGTLERPSARAVCWPERKLHAPIYGDVSRMGRMLAQLGYRRGPFDGARIRLLETSHGDLMLPLLDDLVGVERVDREAGVCLLGSIGGQQSR